MTTHDQPGTCPLCREPLDGAATGAPCPQCGCRIHRADGGDDVAVGTTPEALDSDSCYGFEKNMNRCLQAGIKRFVIDAAELSYMSSAGAGLFVHLISQARKAKGGGVVFAGAQPPVRELLALLGLDRMLELADDVDTGLARFDS